jgi:hypothetical protein
MTVDTMKTITTVAWVATALAAVGGLSWALAERFLADEPAAVPEVEVAEPASNSSSAESAPTTESTADQPAATDAAPLSTEQLGFDPAPNASSR